MRKVFGICLFTFAAIGCQTTRIKQTKYSEGHWEAKVLIKDKRRSESHIVKVDSFAVNNKNLRVDVTAAMGTSVATLVLNGDRVEYMLPQQKRYYRGESSEKVLGPILSVPIDPKLFYVLLFEEPPDDRGWSCQRNAQGLLSLCEQEARGLKVEWKSRKGRKKKILISHRHASMQLNVTNFKPSLKGYGELFTLRVPKGFRRIGLRATP